EWVKRSARLAATALSGFALVEDATLLVEPTGCLLDAAARPRSEREILHLAVESLETTPVRLRKARVAFQLVHGEALNVSPWNSLGSEDVSHRAARFRDLDTASQRADRNATDGSDVHAGEQREEDPAEGASADVIAAIGDFTESQLVE